MNKIKYFDEYLKKGIAKKCKPDQIRAKDIASGAESDLIFFKQIKQKIPLDDANSNNFIGQAYNIIMELIRAKMLTDGYKASGPAAHEAEVSYMIKLGFSEADAEFMDEIRYSRNGIFYYGKRFDSEYAKKVLSFLDIIYPKLKELIKRI